MKIYIDESNTSGAKFEPDPKKLISAGAWVWTQKDEEKCFELFKGKEIKSSEIMTRNKNELLCELLNNINPNQFINFTANFRLLYMLDVTYIIFYPSNFGNSYTLEIEKLRNKICINLLYSNFMFLQKPTTITSKNISVIRDEILLEVNKSRYFTEEDRTLLKTYFIEEVEEVSYSENSSKINPHSTIVGNLIASIYNYAYDKNIAEMEFIIDDFTNDDVKEKIEETIGIFHSKFFESKNNLSIKYQKSEKIIGLWLADLAASIPRKTLNFILKDFDVSTEKVKNNHKNIEGFSFNVKILNWFLQSYEPHFQLPRLEMGISQCIFYGEDYVKPEMISTELAEFYFQKYLSEAGYGAEKQHESIMHMIKSVAKNFQDTKLSKDSEEDFILDRMRDFIRNNLEFDLVDDFNLKEVKEIVVKYFGTEYLKKLSEPEREMKIIYGMYFYMLLGEVMDIDRFKQGR